MPSQARRVSGDAGQVAPVVALLVVLSLAFLGMVLLQLGRAADLRGGAQSAADAAALAAIDRGRDDIVASLRRGDLRGAQEGLTGSRRAMAARASAYAEENDARLVDIRFASRWEVLTVVRTVGEVDDEPVEVTGDRRGRGVAQARLAVSPDPASCVIELPERPPSPSPIASPTATVAPSPTPTPDPLPALLRCAGRSDVPLDPDDPSPDLSRYFRFGPRLVAVTYDF